MLWFQLIQAQHKEADYGERDGQTPYLCLSKDAWFHEYKSASVLSLFAKM